MISHNKRLGPRDMEHGHQVQVGALRPLKHTSAVTVCFQIAQGRPQTDSTSPQSAQCSSGRVYGDQGRLPRTDLQPPRECIDYSKRNHKRVLKIPGYVTHVFCRGRETINLHL